MILIPTYKDYIDIEMAQVQEQTRKKPEGVLVRCKFCDYEWRYKGNLLYGCCPSCRHNTNIAQSSVKSVKEVT